MEARRGDFLKKLKKMESKFVMTPSSNPVNALSIRKSKFGMVGYTTITIDSLRTSKSFKLEKVPNRSPLEGSLLMNLTVHSESSMQEKGFLTYFTEVNGYGDWHRRWCVLRGTLFDKYSLFWNNIFFLHSCIILSRQHSLLLEVSGRRTKAKSAHWEWDDQSAWLHIRDHYLGSQGRVLPHEHLFVGKSSPDPKWRLWGLEYRCGKTILPPLVCLVIMGFVICNFSGSKAWSHDD